jgi:hypothetical protein
MQVYLYTIKYPSLSPSYNSIALKICLTLITIALLSNYAIPDTLFNCCILFPTVLHEKKYSFLLPYLHT